MMKTAVREEEEEEEGEEEEEVLGAGSTNLPATQSMSLDRNHGGMNATL